MHIEKSTGSGLVMALQIKSARRSRRMGLLAIRLAVARSVVGSGNSTIAASITSINKRLLSESMTKPPCPIDRLMGTFFYI
ncbi:MAG: hypothetical protein WC465_05095 [Patescibacteria group bacterium]